MHVSLIFDEYTDILLLCCLAVLLPNCPTARLRCCALLCYVLGATLLHCFMLFLCYSAALLRAAPLRTPLLLYCVLFATLLLMILSCPVLYAVIMHATRCSTAGGVLYPET